MLKKLITFLLKQTWVLFILIGLSSCHQSTMPLTLLSGKTIQKEELAGRWIYINYWANWCKPCLKEIKTFNALYKLEEKENLAVFAVNYDHLEQNELKALIKSQGILYPHFIDDPASAWQLGEVTALPLTFVINPKGQLVKVFFGEQSLKTLLNLKHEA